MRRNKIVIALFALLAMVTLLIPVAFAKTSPIVQQVTGGGWILYSCRGEAKKTFGFNAEELEGGELRGNVEFVDHETGSPHVHGYEITALTITGDTAVIRGICRLNGDNRPRLFQVVVVDEAEPGKHDWFEIWLDSDLDGVLEDGEYWAGNELGFPAEAGGGGNIQVHRPA